MWSYVKLYDHWYGLDTTWNDPIYYGYPSQEQIEQWKVAYFLKGWDEELDEGFYYMPGDEDRRVIQNYQIYYNTEKYGQIIYELPVPEIELKDYVEPSATVETQKSIQAGQALSVVVNIENVENLLENMTVGYRKSDDGGKGSGAFPGKPGGRAYGGSQKLFKPGDVKRRSEDPALRFWRRNL